ncbi:MAG: tryptophan synthase subunit alpha [Deltaproteobacteria bacterium]|jgi:tryptophan synthase alpha chain|nr:tryptophan synthase subunit alpha [Deltaproteobacteria bacterium]
MSALEARIRQAKSKNDILLMTHIVIGYPSFAASLEIVDAMVEAGVDLMELQIPFSEPMADGPVILAANQKAIAAGSTVERCFAFAATVAKKHPIPFLFMSYYNLLFRAGVGSFVARMRAAGVHGAIVPDLPPEEAGEYLDAMQAADTDPIFIFSPSTSDERLRQIAGHARGFVYCVARKGVTGLHTTFSAELDAYLARCRAATRLPLALGFGVQDKTDVAFLRGKVDIAVVGTATLRLIDDEGVSAVGAFVRGLR